MILIFKKNNLFHVSIRKKRNTKKKENFLKILQAKILSQN